MKQQIYDVSIIGAGSIGALKPDNIDSPKTKNILTHAHAIKNNKRLLLRGIVDTNQERLLQACRKWKVAGSVSEIPFSTDIIVISASTKNHFNIMKEVIIDKGAKPKLIICEKPCCSFLKEICDIEKLSNKYKISIAVNYNRMYSSPLRDLKTRLTFGGKIYSATIIYTRGIIRDASHAINFCNYLFGKFLDGKILNTAGIVDYSEWDVTLPVYLSYKKCKHVFLVPSDGRAYSIFDMEIFTEKGKYILSDHFNKISFYPSEKEKIYGNFNSLSEKPKSIIECDLKNSLVALYANCIDFLDQKDKLICSIKDAIDVHRVYNHIFRIK